MRPHLEVIFSPGEFFHLPQRDLSGTTCVVFDILRATTSIITALANGAASVIPVGEISEALALRSKDDSLLLAGEREGFRIRAAQTGSIDFDFGNSPREFVEEKVKDRHLVITTTNGSRALRASSKAHLTLVGTFLNLSAVTQFLLARKPENLLLVCSGTHEEASFEDTLCAGAVADGVWNYYGQGKVADSAQIARLVYLQHKSDLQGAMSLARNGRRLLSIPELAPDVQVCLQRDTVKLLARLESDGAIRQFLPD